MWSVETEPSHALVDRFVNMHEEQVISYVKPELCTSRSQEIVGNKQTQAFSLAPDGSLKVKDKDPEIECNVSGEMRLRMAFQRRSLAADLARVVSFAASEEWTLFLFAMLQRETPKGFKSVSMSQLIAADKHMWILLSEKSRGNVVAGPGQPLPCDAHLKTLSSSPEVLNFLTPLPEPQFVDRRPAPYTSSSSKGDGKGKKGKEPKGKSAVLSVPENCHLNTPEGKPISIAGSPRKSNLGSVAVVVCTFAINVLNISHGTSVRTTDRRCRSQFHLVVLHRPVPIRLRPCQSLANANAQRSWWWRL